MTIPAFPRRHRGGGLHASHMGQSSIISQAPHTTLDIDKEGEQNNHNIITRRSVPHQLDRQQSSSTMSSKLIPLVIGMLVILVAVPLLHKNVSMNPPVSLNLQTSSSSGWAQNQKNDVAVDEEDKHGLALALVAVPASKDDSPKHKPTKENKTYNKIVAWEVMPAKDADATGVDLKPATICACAKCGTTSLWTEFFSFVQGKSYDSMDYKGPPWIHDLSNKLLWTNIQAKKKTDWSNFKKQDSFALIRDPKERIFSAWKSKVTCDIKHEINGHMRLVPHLLELAGSRTNITARVDMGFPCLNLSDYLALLSQIHAHGKEGFLDGHFLPQHLGCFKDAPPSMWSVVTTISDPKALCSLKSVFLRSTNTSNSKADNACQMRKSHAREFVLNLTREDEVILEKITSKEYVMLEQYLP